MSNVSDKQDFCFYAASAYFYHRNKLSLRYALSAILVSFVEFSNCYYFLIYYIAGLDIAG